MPAPAATDYHDRSTGLILFGVAEIVIGFFCGLAIPLVLFARVVAHRAPNPSPPPTIFSAVVVYAIFAASFIWLGIGSILARRWARAILLSLSGVALCAGVLGSAFLAFILPRMFNALNQAGQPPLPPAGLIFAKVIFVGFAFVAYILIPASIFLFYRSPHVKRTCEARDPVERWTDKCPLPVLALCLLMALCGIVALSLLGSFHGYPFFGIFVPGAAGFLLMVAFSGLAFLLARGLYRLRLGAWWAALGLLLFYGASNTVTFWGGDLGGTFARMGIDRRAAALAAQMSGSFRWLLPLTILPWVIWLLCIRGYFTPQATPPVITDGEPPVL